MKNYFAPPPFPANLKLMLAEEKIPIEKLALDMRYSSRKAIYDVLKGRCTPTVKFVASSAVVLDLAPHAARCYFRAAGYDLDAETPECKAIRAVIDGPHDDDHFEAKLDYLATYGLANKFR